MKKEYYHTKESVDEYINLAKDVSGKELIEKLEKVLAHNSKLLEIGSGPGTDWNILDEHFDVTGSDSSQEFLNHLKTKNTKGEFLDLNAVTLNTGKKFDGIYSNKVLHHLKDSEIVNSVKRQSDILNPNGIVCHSFWKGEGSEVFKGLFVNYYDEGSLKRIFEGQFQIISIESYCEFEDGDSLLLIARKK